MSSLFKAVVIHQLFPDLLLADRIRIAEGVIVDGRSHDKTVPSWVQTCNVKQFQFFVQKHQLLVLVWKQLLLTIVEQ